MKTTINTTTTKTYTFTWEEIDNIINMSKIFQEIYNDVKENQKKFIYTEIYAQRPEAHATLMNFTPLFTLLKNMETELGVITGEMELQAEEHEEEIDWENLIYEEEEI